MTQHQKCPKNIFTSLFLSAGSKLEQVIGEGADALNAYISSGEIEELNDVIPQPDDEDTENNDDEEDSDETPDAKRPKTDRIVNHNAQIIYGNNDSQPAIPSLMALDVKVDVPLGKDGAGNWGASAGFNKNAPNQPPSLLNLNVAPPFDDIGSSSAGGGWQSGRGDYNRSSKDGQKRRNRDSDGNRISRFDREGGSRSSRFESNDSGGGGGGRNRRSGNSNSGSSRQERSSGRSNRRI